MTDKIQDIQTMLNGLYEGGDITNAARSSLQFVINEAKKEAINYTPCCTTLKIRELMTFEDYKNNLFIKADGIYQPKKSKIFRWYSEKQLKKMYNDEPL